MGELAGRPLQAAIETLFRAEARRVKATLVRLLGDFDLAEDALQDAFVAALQQWPQAGVPANPAAWLVSAGRFRAIDRLRRRARFDASLAELAWRIEEGVSAPEADAPAEPADDRLRLIFICCHPALNPEARVALTLREVCGLTTEAIAAAFLISPPTLAQRIVRAKNRIRELRLPYAVPAREALPARRDAVLQVIYLVFNEGYFASSGEALTRAELSAEAIRLGRELAGLLPQAEVVGLLALMLLTEARRPARTDAAGEPVLLAEQDRSRWHAGLIAEGCALVEQALRSGGFGPYTVQAAIAAVHAEADCAADTDWDQIVGLYDVLLRLSPTPVVELNRAVAVAMRDGAGAGLALLDALLARGELETYGPAHSARAELCRRLGRCDEACAAYHRALGLSRQAPERRFLADRLRALEAGGRRAGE